MVCGTGGLSIEAEVLKYIPKDQTHKSNPDCIESDMLFYETVMEATPYT